LITDDDDDDDDDDNNNDRPINPAVNLYISKKYG